MRAVFLRGKKLEIVNPPIRDEAEPDAEPFYAGIGEITEKVHTIRIAQYLRMRDEDFLRLAFCSGKGEEIEFEPEQECVVLREDTEKECLWIPQGFTFSMPGEMEFLYRKNEDTFKIHVQIEPVPGAQYYQSILRDLKSITIRLLYCAKHEGKNRRLYREYLTEYDVEVRRLTHSIKAFSDVLRSLDRDPMADVESRPARKAFRQVKQIRADAIMDHYVLHKPKVRTFVHERTYNIYENQKIYSFLKLLERRVDEISTDLVRKEEEAEEKRTQKPGIHRSLAELQVKLEDLKKQLQDLCQLTMFRKKRIQEQKVYPLRSSNLFVNHKKYKKLFHEMRAYREVGELLEETGEYRLFRNSSEIYEVWCFFKILEILTFEKNYVIDRVAWPGEGSGKLSSPFVFIPWEEAGYAQMASYVKRHIGMRENRDAQKGLEELVLHLTNGTQDIYVGYNCTFRGIPAVLAHETENGTVRKTSNRLRPDIFLLLNREVFFACDAKYKNYKACFMGLNEWYTDLFECAADKYIYRLDLGNEPLHERAQSALSVRERFTGEDALKTQIKNGGACILSPAISESVMPVYYNGESIGERYEEFLRLLREGRVNREANGKERLCPEEFTDNLKQAIEQEHGGCSVYEYRVASTRFLPENSKGFQSLFFEALEYGKGHFLRAIL